MSSSRRSQRHYNQQYSGSTRHQSYHNNTTGSIPPSPASTSHSSYNSNNVYASPSPYKQRHRTPSPSPRGGKQYNHTATAAASPSPRITDRVYSQDYDDVNADIPFDQQKPLFIDERGPSFDEIDQELYNQQLKGTTPSTAAYTSTPDTLDDEYNYRNDRLGRRGEEDGTMQLLQQQQQSSITKNQQYQQHHSPMKTTPNVVDTSFGSSQQSDPTQQTLDDTLDVTLDDTIAQKSKQIIEKQKQRNNYSNLNDISDDFSDEVVDVNDVIKEARKTLSYDHEEEDPHNNGNYKYSASIGESKDDDGSLKVYPEPNEIDQEVIGNGTYGAQQYHNQQQQQQSQQSNIGLSRSYSSTNVDDGGQNSNNNNNNHESSLLSGYSGSNLMGDKIHWTTSDEQDMDDDENRNYNDPLSLKPTTRPSAVHNNNHSSVAQQQQQQYDDPSLLALTDTDTEFASLPPNNNNVNIRVTNTDIHQEGITSAASPAAAAAAAATTGTTKSRKKEQQPRSILRSPVGGASYSNGNNNTSNNIIKKNRNKKIRNISNYDSSSSSDEDNANDVLKDRAQKAWNKREKMRLSPNPIMQQQQLLNNNRAFTRSPSQVSFNKNLNNVQTFVKHPSDDDDDNITHLTGFTGISLNSTYTKSVESEVEDLVKDIFLVGHDHFTKPGRRRRKHQPYIKQRIEHKKKQIKKNKLKGGGDQTTNNNNNNMTTPSNYLFGSGKNQSHVVQQRQQQQQQQQLHHHRHHRRASINNETSGDDATLSSTIASSTMGAEQSTIDGQSTNFGGETTTDNSEAFTDDDDDSDLDEKQQQWKAMKKKRLQQQEQQQSKLKKDQRRNNRPSSSDDSEDESDEDGHQEDHLTKRKNDDNPLDFVWSYVEGAAIALGLQDEPSSQKQKPTSYLPHSSSRQVGVERGRSLTDYKDNHNSKLAQQRMAHQKIKESAARQYKQTHSTKNSTRTTPAVIDGGDDHDDVQIKGRSRSAAAPFDEFVGYAAHMFSGNGDNNRSNNGRPVSPASFEESTALFESTLDGDETFEESMTNNNESDDRNTETPSPTGTGTSSSSTTAETTDSKSLEDDERLLELSLFAARSKHEALGMQYDERVRINVMKEVTFNVVRIKLPMGILFQENDAGCWVTKIFPNGNAKLCPKGGTVEIGDQLAAINGISAIEMKVDKICDIVQQVPKNQDVELTFLRYIGPMRPSPNSFPEEGYEVQAPNANRNNDGHQQIQVQKQGHQKRQDALPDPTKNDSKTSRRGFFGGGKKKNDTTKEEEQSNSNKTSKKGKNATKNNKTNSEKAAKVEQSAVLEKEKKKRGFKLFGRKKK